MYLLLIALLLTLLKYAEVGPVAEWSWWAIVGVYGATALWWMWADYSGYTRRKAEDRMTARKDARLQRQKDVLKGPGRSPR